MIRKLSDQVWDYYLVVGHNDAKYINGLEINNNHLLHLHTTYINEVVKEWQPVVSLFLALELYLD